MARKKGQGVKASLRGGQKPCPSPAHPSTAGGEGSHPTIGMLWQVRVFYTMMLRLRLGLGCWTVFICLFIVTVTVLVWQDEFEFVGIGRRAHALAIVPESSSYLRPRRGPAWHRSPRKVGSASTSAGYQGGGAPS
eukprot:scaffold17500_cov126-Isochrysis_galbana.AAC.8